MFIESTVTKEFYEAMTAEFVTDCDFSVEWVAKNSEELEKRGIDTEFLNEDNLPPDEEYYYIRVWFTCDIEEIGMAPFIKALD